MLARVSALSTQYFLSGRLGMTLDSSGPSCARLDDPQTQNRYTYTRNNPIDFVDPPGLNLSEGEDFDCTCTRYHYSNLDGTIGFWGPWGCSCTSGGGVGGSGGVGQPGRPINRAGDASERLDRFLHDHQDCEQAINSAIERDSGGAKRDLQELFTVTSFENWHDHADQTLFELGLASPAPDFSDTTPLRLLLGRNTVRFSALTNPLTRTVYLGWAFAHTADEALKDQTIIHELLHVAFTTHLKLAKALGLKKDGQDYTDNVEASQAIDSWLDNNCH